MKKSGFTLAEVLITLVIIGIIAAITIPAMMNRTDDAENIVAFKKALSVMNQALNTEYSLEGNTAAYTAQPISGLPAFAKDWKGLAAIMAKRTNIIDPNVAMFGETTTSTGSSQVMFSTADGLIYSIPIPWSSKTSCPFDSSECLSGDCDVHYPSVCGHGWVDVNGKKGPNKFVDYGQNPGDKYVVKDRFKFAIFETSVMPGIIRNSIESRLIYGKKTSR